MDPLYCFKFDIDNNKIQKITIKDYSVSEKSFSISRCSYKFINTVTSSGKYYWLESTKLDRYVSNKVFTFNNSVDYAKQIAIDTIKAKQKAAQAEYDRCSALLSAFDKLK